MMKNIMSEQEMEKALQEQGFDIMTNDEENVVDSTKVVDFAIDLGYEVTETDTGELKFER